MEKSDVLVEIGRIMEEEWDANSRPVLLSNLPRALERTLGADYKIALEDKTLKAFLQENSEDSRSATRPGSRASRASRGDPSRPGYAFPTSVTSSSPITAADARAFGQHPRCDDTRGAADHNPAGKSGGQAARREIGRDECTSSPCCSRPTQP